MEIVEKVLKGRAVVDADKAANKLTDERQKRCVILIVISLCDRCVCVVCVCACVVCVCVCACVVCVCVCVCVCVAVGCIRRDRLKRQMGQRKGKLARRCLAGARWEREQKEEEEEEEEEEGEDEEEEEEEEDHLN